MSRIHMVFRAAEEMGFIDEDAKAGIADALGIDRTSEQATRGTGEMIDGREKQAWETAVDTTRRPFARMLKMIYYAHMRKSEISFLTACAKKGLRRSLVLALWAFLKEKDENLFTMADWIEGKDCVSDGQLLAKMTQLTTDLPVPMDWVE